MSDEIKIRVGVQNNVKAGMDGVVRDVRQGSQHFEQIGKTGGKGFAEAFGKAIRGDISGAMAGLNESLEGGMKGLTAKAVVWGGGIATALFAGIKAGQQLDKAFGLSDKIGGYFAGKFGAQEDTGLKQQLEDLRAARKEREEAAKEEIENQRKIKQAAIDGIEAQNEAIQDLGAEASKMAFQRAIDQKRFNEQAQAGGEKQGIVGRIMGRGDLDIQGVADRDMKAALDDDFRRQEADAERQVTRADNRRKKLLDMARKAGSEGRARSPQLQRVWDAERKATDAADLRNNLDQLQKRAAEASIEAQKNALETAENTREIKRMQKELLTRK
jgi:hypothetical protein